MNQLFSGVSLFLLLICSTFPCFSLGIEFSKEPQLPPRIIRTCCAFGSNVGVIGLPYFSYSEITGVENIGKHKYLGDESEGNGIIYTRKGGFIDMAHLRDQSDWTAYLYYIIKIHKGIPDFEIKLGYEGGTKMLSLNVPNDLSDRNMKILAGRIAYDLSVWHEIASWFGLSSVPLLNERFSSFSLEDNYSNLLGATIGIEALESELPYNDAMTKLLNDKLVELERVDSISQTYDAMEKVLNKWWTRYYYFPQNNVTLKRQFSTYSITNPLIVPGFSDSEGEICSLDIPQLENTSLKFQDIYTINLKLNGRLMSKRFFASMKKKEITNWDFMSIVNEITIESNRKLEKISKSFDLN
jgi:hypothetical protein